MVGDRIAGQVTLAMLELRGPAHRGAYAGAQNDQRIVAGGMQNRVVKIPVGHAAGFAGQRVPRHAGQCVAHALERCLIAPLRCQCSGSRLDDGAKFEQAADKGDVRLTCKGPAQHFRVEQIPAVSRQDTRASLGPAFDQTLGREHLDRFAVRAARYVQQLGEHDFSGKHLAWKIFPGQDRSAQLVGNRAVQAPTGTAGFARALDRFC